MMLLFVVQDVLVPLFEMRLMLDFDGAHRGFAYVKFCQVTRKGQK